MNHQKDIVGDIIIITLLIMLTVTGIISYKSIDWKVLKKLEDQPLILPTPIPASNSATQK